MPHLTMDDVDSILNDNHYYVVVCLDNIPHVDLVTDNRNKAMQSCVAAENNVILKISPEVIKAVREGNILEIDCELPRNQ